MMHANQKPNTVVYIIALLAMVAVAGHGATTQIETTTYQPCNTKPPLRCNINQGNTDQGSTFVRVSFAESLSGLPLTTYVGNWTTVASNTIPGTTNIGLNSCSATSCIPLAVPLVVNITIVRALVAYDLEQVPGTIPYGYFLNKIVGNGLNNSVTKDPTLLRQATTCMGIVAPLNADNVCYQTAPNISASLIAGQLGPVDYQDTAFGSAATWLPNSRALQCQGIICYPCTGVPNMPTSPTLYTSYAFGPKCTVWKVKTNAQQTNYEVDVFFNVTAADGSLTGGSIYFTSLSNFGTDAKIEPRLSYTRLARGWFEKLSTVGQSSDRLDGISAPLDGAGIVVCSIDGSPVFDQGFFYPWNQSIPNNVPTATGTNGSQSWFFLNKDAMTRALGPGCGQIGAIKNLAPQLSQFNLTDACVRNLVQTGFCVPGYSNTNSTTTPSNSLTPALVINALNQYAADVLDDPTTPQPAFLPPGWTPNAPPYYLRKLSTGSYQLAFQPSSFQKFDVQGTFVVQISNDVVIYGNQSQKLVVDPVASLCNYSPVTGQGNLLFYVCNQGLDTVNTTFYLNLVSCTANVNFTDSPKPSPPLVIAITNLSPGQCTYTPAYSISSLDPAPQTPDYVSVGYRKFLVFGSCSYFVYNNQNTTALFGTPTQPATISCFAVPNPLRAAQPETFTQCTFTNPVCPEMVWARIFVIAVPILLVILVVVIVGFSLILKYTKKPETSTYTSGHQKID